MVNLEEVKKLIEKELKPAKAKIAEYEKKIAEMDESYNFLSAKYVQLLKQLQSLNEKSNKLEKKTSVLQTDLNNVETVSEDLAQYLRRDCVEISGVDPSEGQSCNDIVVSLSEEMGIKIDDRDISTAHVLPTYNKNKDKKIIVKFTRRDIKNEFYTNRKKIAGRKISSLKSLGKKGENKVYISESLTPKRKKLFGAVNNIKKKLNWKFIWTNNGRIYLRESDNSVSFTFDSIADLVNFENKQHLAPSAITNKICSTTR
jgi:small-conductance mechanosensitive channel